MDKGMSGYVAKHETELMSMIISGSKRLHHFGQRKVYKKVKKFRKRMKSNQSKWTVSTVYCKARFARAKS